jgi:hypothetical protein
VVRLGQVSEAQVLQALLPAARGPSTPRAPEQARFPPVALQVPEAVLVSEPVPASAHGQVSVARVPALAAHHPRKRRARNVPLRVAVAVVSSSIPRPKKAR